MSAPWAFGQAAGPVRLPYLIRGVTFYINNDRVRCREQPGLQGRILGVLDKGTVVIPIEVSDHTETIGETHPWYRCVVEPDRKTSGWVFGQYVSARLELKEDRVSLLTFRGRGGPTLVTREGSPVSYDLALQFTCSFVNGELIRLTGGQLREAIPADARYRVLDPAGAQELATISITHMADATLPWAGAAILSKAKAPQGLEGWIERDAALSRDIVLASGRYFPEVTRQADSSQAQPLQRYICSEFQACAGSLPRFDQIRVDVFQMSECPVLDNGRPAPSTCYYCHFLGMYRSWSLLVECFLVKHPDGSMVRSNLIVDAEEKDYRTTESVFHPGLPWPYSTDWGMDLKDFPTTLIVVDEAMYEGTMDSLYVTNGYIVFGLGTRNEEGPAGDFSAVVD